MRETQRRLSTLVACIVVVLIASALLYRLGMNTLENTPRDFWASLAWAGETLTTTGYGHDETWKHPVMVLFVIAVQFIGVFPPHFVPA